MSQSAVQAYRQCQQLYAYRYVERLRRKDRVRYFQLGNILHRYLEVYYAGLKSGQSANDAHSAACITTSAEYIPTLRQQALELKRQSREVEAHDTAELMNVARRIVDRYFKVRGENDADEYTILLVEQAVSVPLSRTVSSNGRLDMVTQHNDTGRVHLWEHKSAAEIPSNEYRLRDLQTTIYNESLYALNMIDERVDAVMWNYLRTKEPTVPEQLKAGGLTQRANLDSTWEVYLGELERLKLAVADYQEQRQRLEDREETVFFPRHEHVIIARPKMLIRDYVQTARDIQRSREAWRQNKRKPVKNLSITCDWCEFKDLCQAQLFTGSDRDARSRFTIGG